MDYIATCTDGEQDYELMLDGEELWRVYADRTVPGTDIDYELLEELNAIH